MLLKHDLPLAPEDSERCDTMRYMWEKLQVHTVSVQDNLLLLQPTFRKTLDSEVKIFIEDCNDFYKSYDEVWFDK